MIKTDINKLFSLYPYHASISKIIHFLETNDLNCIQEAFNIYIDDDIFYNCFSYTTTCVDNLSAEVHAQYIDFHIIIKGTEYIGVGQVMANMPASTYDIESDSAFVKIKDASYIRMTEGSALWIEPYEVHMPKIKTERNELVKKIVFKIPKQVE